MLDGPSAVAYGAPIVEMAREIVGLLKDFPLIQLRGAVLDGNLFKGDAGVKELAKFPTKAESQANIVTLVVSPGRTLLGAVMGPAGAVMGIIKAIETKLEKGEAITKV